MSKDDEKDAPRVLKFGPLEMDTSGVIRAFMPEEAMIDFFASRHRDQKRGAVDREEVRREYRWIRQSWACDGLREYAAAAVTIAQTVFRSERVKVTEDRARHIVVAYARGEKYQAAKALVIAAAMYVRGQEVLRALGLGHRGRPTEEPSWDTVFEAFQLASWMTTLGVYYELEVARGTAGATAARRARLQRRISELADGIRRGDVKRSTASVLRWYRQQNKPITYERARTDLHKATALLDARSTPPKPR
jgi:hypothetical protein